MAGNWTMTDVADRFEEAVYTMRRLPPVRVQGYFSAWPPIVRTVMEQLQADKLPMRLGPPPADAISRMEETFEWICWLEEEERKIIWLRASRVRWKQIQWRMGYGKTKTREIWTVALLKIAHRLNGGNRGKK